MMVLRLAALGSFLFLPGWATVLILDRGTLDFWERAYLGLVLGTALVSLGAFFLVSLGQLRLVYLLLIVLIPTLLLSLAVGRKRRTSVRAGKAKIVHVVLVFSVVVMVISPPSRIIYGWSDVGIYPNIAAQMIRKGKITINDPLVSRISPENRDLVFRPNENPEVPIKAYQNKALFITDFESGEITPQFLYLWPSLMAVFGFFLRMENMFWAITWVSLLALAGIFLAARRWLGTNWAYLVAFLLLISPLFLYFSRYTTSEMFNACLFLAALICHAAYAESQSLGRKKEALGMAVASSSLLCIGFLCRLDFYGVLPVILIFYLGKRLFSEFQTADWAFFLLCISGGALSALVNFTVSRPYFIRVALALGEPLRFLLRFPGALIIAAYLAVFIGGRSIGRKIKPFVGEFVDRSRNVLAALFCSGLWIYMAYLFFIRPGQPQTFGSYGEINAVIGPTFNNETIFRWAWYFSWLGVAAIFIGYALFLLKRKDFSSRLFGFVGLTFTVLYSFSLHCTPMHILTMRRLLPVVLPLGMIMMVYPLRSVTALLADLKEKKWLNRVGKVVVTGIIVYLAAFFLYVSGPVFGLREGGNQLELFRETAESVQDGGVLFMDLHSGDIFGVPLTCVFDVENLWLSDNFILGKKGFFSLLKDVDFPHRPVYILWRPGTNIVSIPVAKGLRYELVRRVFWREEMLEQSFISRPAKRTYHLEEFEIYRVTKAEP